MQVNGAAGSLALECAEREDRMPQGLEPAPAADSGSSMTKQHSITSAPASGSGPQLSRTRPLAGARGRVAQLPVDARSRRRLAAPSHAPSVPGARGVRGGRVRSTRRSAGACGFGRGVKIHLSTSKV
jgi:hypothetical protein